jgi:hypothetical protein
VRRGGWYGYDRIDNHGIPSTVKVLPEWQHLKVGDTVPIWRNRFLRARINTTAWRWGCTLSKQQEK